MVVYFWANTFTVGMNLFILAMGGVKCGLACLTLVSNESQRKITLNSKPVEHLTNSGGI